VQAAEESSVTEVRLEEKCHADITTQGCCSFSWRLDIKLREGVKITKGGKRYIASSAVVYRLLTRQELNRVLM